MSDVYVPTEAPSGGDAEMSEFLGPTELPCDSPTSVAGEWAAGDSPTEVADERVADEWVAGYSPTSVADEWVAGYSPTEVADEWVAGYSPTEVAPDESHEVHSAVFPRLRIWHLSRRGMDPIRSCLVPAGYGGVVPSRVFRRRGRLWHKHNRAGVHTTRRFAGADPDIVFSCFGRKEQL